MSKNIVIQEGGVGRQFTADKLKTALVGGGSCNWVPEDEVQLSTLTVSENGTYSAEDEGDYGYSQVIVNVPGGAGGPPGGEGSSIVGTDPGTGNDELVSVSDGNIEMTELPSSITIETAPTKVDYIDGDPIDYSGLVVKAYTKNGELWTDADHPDGIIPISELTLSETEADSKKSDHDQDYPDARFEGTVEVTGVGSITQAFNELLSLMHGTVDDGGIFANYIYPILANYDGKVAGIVTGYLDAPNGFEGGGPFTISVLLDVKEGTTVNLGLASPRQQHITFYSTGRGGFLRVLRYDNQYRDSLLERIFLGTYDDSMHRISTINAVVRSGQTIPVQWYRSGDLKVLEASFNITVTEAEV